MRIYYLPIIIALFACQVLASATSASFFHMTPQGTVRGNDVTFEVMLSPDNSGIYDLYLFYRQLGENEFRSARMDRVGYLYSISLHTNNFNTGQVEYYLGYEGRLGEIGTLPDESPQMNPYILRVAPNNTIEEQSSAVEILVLSPEPEEMVRFDELLISASVLGLEDDFNFSNSKLFIDGTNVTTLAEIRDGVFTFSPKQIRSGYHNIELIILDNSNNELGRQEWSFRATGGQDTRTETGSTYRGSVFLENRHTNIAENSQNYFRAGGTVSGGFNAWRYNGRLIYSSEETPDRQPVNRYSARLSYHFSERNQIMVQGGDFTPYYNKLAFQNKRVRGVDANLELGFFTFDFVYGQLYRGIEGDTIMSYINLPGQDSTVVDTTIGRGINEENVMAFRPGFRFGDNVHWNLNMISSSQNAVQNGGNLYEALIMGTDLKMNFDNNRIMFDASFQTSINNTDAGSAEVTYEERTKGDSSLQENETAKKYWDFLSSLGMISMTDGLNPIPSIGMRFEAAFRYWGNNLIARYNYVERSFASPGNPYLLKDVSGFYIADNIRLFDNQVFLNLFYRGFLTNRSAGSYKTNNNELGVTFSYFPRSDLPSLSISYFTIDRSNDVTADSDEYENPAFFMINNKTQNINVATSYNFDISSTRNTVSLNLSNYGRSEDLITNKQSESDFLLYGIGVVTNYRFPLISKLNYSQSNSSFGAGPTESTTDIQRIFVGLEYKMQDLIGTDTFRPFVNFVWQNIKLPNVDDAKRNNYSLGLLYRSPKLGVLSVRYDSISYGEGINYSDSILNARYQYNF